MDKGLQSIFNEAALKMQRIHESQNLINSLNVNLLMFNSSAGKYNYEVVASEYFNLLDEAWGKLDTNGKTEGKKWKKLLMESLETIPIYSVEYEEGFGDKKKITKLNKKNWDIVRSILFDFGTFVREKLEKHGLSGANRDDEVQGF